VARTTFANASSADQWNRFPIASGTSGLNQAELIADFSTRRMGETPQAVTAVSGPLDRLGTIPHSLQWNGLLIVAIVRLTHRTYSTTATESKPLADLREVISDRGNVMPYHIRMPELVFEVVQEADGGYCAECLTENIYTQGDTWEELRRNVIEATSAFFFDRPRPERVRLHLIRDEVLSVA